MKRSYTLPAILLTTLATACWPYLSDDYESYVDGTSDPDGTDGTGAGEELFFVGQVAWTSQRGTYWGEGSTDGELVGGSGIVYLIDSGPRSALSRYAGGDGRCQSGDSANSNYDNALDVSEPGDVVLSGRAELTLPWLSDQLFWGASVDEATNLGHGSTYDMDVIDTRFGSIGGDDLVSMPRALTISTPNMTGDTPPSVGRSAIELSWTNQANAVIMGFTTVSGEGEVLDSIYCGVTGASSSFTVTVDELPSLATAAYTVIEVGNVSNGTGSIGNGFTNEVAGIHWQVGAVFP